MINIILEQILTVSNFGLMLCLLFFAYDKYLCDAKNEQKHNEMTAALIALREASVALHETIKEITIRR